MKTTTTPQKTATLHTLGCRLNSAETATIAQGFVNRGYQLVPWGQAADVVFINTCTVTNQADATCRNLIRKAHRYAPQAKIVVAGCYAQMAAQQIHQPPRSRSSAGNPSQAPTLPLPRPPQTQPNPPPSTPLKTTNSFPPTPPPQTTTPEPS